jgi:hypothetical protein
MTATIAVSSTPGVIARSSYDRFTLIYLSTLVPEDVWEEDRQALRRNVKEAWKTIVEFLGRDKSRLWPQ